jgi:hypothetical protein
LKLLINIQMCPFHHVHVASQLCSYQTNSTVFQNSLLLCFLFRTMLPTKLCRIPVTSFVAGLGRPLNKPQLCMRTRVQQLASDSRSGVSRRAQKRGVKETLAAPAGETGKQATTELSDR